MSVYKRFHNATHLCATTGILLYATSSGASGTGFIGLLFVFFAWTLFGRTATSPIPRIAINTSLLLASGYMMLRVSAAPGDAIVILSEYLVVLLLIKLFEDRTPRDQAQSLAICAMLGVGAVLTDLSMWTGVLLITHIVVLLIASTRYQLWAGHHATYARSDTASADTIETVPSQGRRTRWRLRVVTLLLLTMIGVGGVTIFIAMPRRASDSSARFDIFGEEATSVSGFQDHIQLGAAGLISQSREVVATVGLETDGLLLTQPVFRYFRGSTQDEYDTRKGLWSASNVLKRYEHGRRLAIGIAEGDHGAHLDRGEYELPALNSGRNAGRFPDGLNVIDQHFELVNKTSDNLFALAQPIQVAYAGQSWINLNPIDRTLTLPGRVQKQAYSVRSATNYARPPTPEEWEDYTTRRSERPNPFEDEQVGHALRELALEIMANAGIEREFDAPPSREDDRIVRLFEQHLGERCAYTLEMVAPDDQRDATVYFLFDSKRGHCEYFASALAGLCRSVGIDARLVTGFVTSEVNQDTGRYVIRKSHAHAWVEAPVVESVAFYPENDPERDMIREDRLLWKTYDPSPQSFLGSSTLAGSSFTDTLRMWLYRFEDLWVASVVQYDADAQQSLLGISGDEQVETLGGWLDTMAANQTGVISGAPMWVRRLMVPGLAIAGCVLVAIAFRRLGVDHAVLKRRTRDRRTRKGVTRIDRALRRLNAPRPEHRALLDHARLMQGESRTALERVANVMYKERFGGSSSTRGETAEAIVALERLSKGGEHARA